MIEGVEEELSSDGAHGVDNVFVTQSYALIPQHEWLIGVAQNRLRQQHCRQVDHTLQYEHMSTYRVARNNFLRARLK